MASFDIYKENSVRIIAGPCSVESFEQLDCVANFLKELGLTWMRGGAFKPRTSPHSFQGLGFEGVDILQNVAHAYKLKTVTEVVDSLHIPYLMKRINCLQVGARNMTNYELLKSLAKQTANTQVPILFKRSMASTIDEWFQTVDYLSEYGNKNIIMCERGICSFEPATRYTLDIAAIPLTKMQTQYPIAVDTSHPAGDAELVPALTKAALAAGADAILIEVHPDPPSAKSDANQQLSFSQFEKLLGELRRICVALDKVLI